MHEGFKFWLLNGFPIYAFLRHSSKVLDFHNEIPAICHLTFAVEIRHCFALGDKDNDNHTNKGEQVYICIHHAQC